MYFTLRFYLLDLLQFFLVRSVELLHVDNNVHIHSWGTLNKNRKYCIFLNFPNHQMCDFNVLVFHLNQIP